MSALPEALAAACISLQEAEGRFFDSVEAYVLSELATLSQRLPGRTVTFYSGNGSVSLHISRRRPLAYGNNAERADFIVYDYQIPDKDSNWARWLPVPDFLKAIDEAETESKRDFITPIGAFIFRDGEAV